MKQRYLVVYDYGTGGLWAFIRAGSRDAILSKFPQLEIIDQRPEWMTKEEYDHTGTQLL